MDKKQPKTISKIFRVKLLNGCNYKAIVNALALPRLVAILRNIILTSNKLWQAIDMTRDCDDK